MYRKNSHILQSPISNFSDRLIDILYTLSYTHGFLQNLMFTKPSQDILMPSANVDPPNPLADIDRQKPISIIFIKIASQAK